MSSAETKWDGIYSGADAANAKPCSWLEARFEELPSPGYALELACGLGGNAQFLAKRGWQVDAVDVSKVALAKLSTLAQARGLAINTIPCDLEKDGGAHQQALFSRWYAHYHLIIVSAYLHRPLFDYLSKWLAPSGVLVYQTWLRDKPAGLGPSNPHFLLERGELAAWAHSAEPALTILVDLEAPPEHENPAQMAGQAVLVAQRQA